MQYSVLCTVDVREQIHLCRAKVRDPIMGINMAMSPRILFPQKLSPRLSERDDD